MFLCTLLNYGLEKAVTARQYLRYIKKEGEKDPLYSSPTPWGQVEEKDPQEFDKKAKLATQLWIMG